MNLNNSEIFVFGSNLSGIHGAGAAKTAFEQYGAILGQGIGLQGKSYAIPTKDFSINTLPLDSIKKHINNFINFAKTNPNLTFIVTRIGCGLAGYKDHEIAPLFKEAPKNCAFDIKWSNYLPNANKFFSF